MAGIIMPDFQKTGGLLESRKIADMAHTCLADRHDGHCPWPRDLKR